MESSTVLFVSSDRELRNRFQKVVRDSGSRTRLCPASGAFDALKRITETPCRAAVCVVDTPDEIGCVVRLKKARRDLPIVMMTSKEDSTLRSLGEQMGADRVLCVRADFDRNVQGLLRVLETRELLRQTRPHVGRTQELAPDVRRLDRDGREFIANTIGLAAACERGDFCLLIVDDAEADRLLLSRGLVQSGLPSFFRSVTSAEEALRYLRGEDPYQNRSIHPMPSLVISDLNLPGRSGLDLLRILRNDPELKRLGFVLYTSSEREEDRAQAALLGANFYIAKSYRPDLVVEIVHMIFSRFIRERTGLPL